MGFHSYIQFTFSVCSYLNVVPMATDVYGIGVIVHMSMFDIIKVDDVYVYIHICCIAGPVCVHVRMYAQMCQFCMYVLFYQL